MDFVGLDASLPRSSIKGGGGYSDTNWNHP